MSVIGHMVVESLVNGQADIDPSDPIILSIPTVANNNTEASAIVAMSFFDDVFDEDNSISTLV